MPDDQQSNPPNAVEESPYYLPLRDYPRWTPKTAQS